MANNKAQTDSKAAQGVVGDRVAVAAFAGSHGVHGDVKLRSFTADPEAVFDFDELYLGAAGEPVRIEFRKMVKGAYAVAVDGIENREDAQALNGQELFVPRSALDEGDEEEFLYADLIGLRVKTPAGKSIGIVQGVENYGADDLLELILNEPVKGLGRFALIPFTKALVPTVKVSGGFVVVDIQSWLDAQAMSIPESQMEAESKADND